MSLKISIADALDGSLLKIVSNNQGWLKAFGDSYFTLSSQAGGDVFKFVRVSPTEFRLFLNGDPEWPVHCDKDGGEQLRSIKGYSGKNSGEINFYLTTDRFDPTNIINLDTTPFLSFRDPNGSYFLRSKSAGHSFGYATTNGRYRSWYINDADRQTIGFDVFESGKKGPYYEIYDDIIANPIKRAGCCNSAYDGLDDQSIAYKRVCTNLGHTGAGPVCDQFMDQSFCPTHLDNEYCGCYNAAAELSTTFPDITGLARSSLLANPKCWSSKCNKSYQNARNRQPVTCDFTFCDQKNVYSGSNNIVTSSGGQQLCQSGVPVLLDPTKPIYPNQATNVPSSGLPNISPSNPLGISSNTSDIPSPNIIPPDIMPPPGTSASAGTSVSTTTTTTPSGTTTKTTSNSASIIDVPLGGGSVNQTVEAEVPSYKSKVFLILMIFLIFVILLVTFLNRRAEKNITIQTT